MRILTPQQQIKWNAVILDVLEKFITICKEHKLTYFCCGGTAIGAIRHHGMIPWDDDVDVFMPRPEYDRFIQIASQMDLGKYELVTPYTYDNYPLYFVKLCNRETTLQELEDTPCVYGLYIDIFPIDGAPDDYEQARAMERRFTKTKNKLAAISSHVSFMDYLRFLLIPKEWGRFVRKTFGFFFRGTYRRLLLRKMNSICYKYDYSTSKLVAVYCGSYGPKEVFPKEWLQGIKQFQFEGLTVDLPSGYDQYLRQYYGDYMQLPPGEKRQSHHFKAYFNLDVREEPKEVFRKVKSER